MSKYILETCAGSLEDCIVSEKAGADRIELNTAVHMGGLTPSLGLVKKVLEEVNIPIIAMIRPRGGSFVYNDEDKAVMFEDAKILLEAGVDGLAFGFLSEEFEVDIDSTKKMVDLCHRYDAEAVFHRAFDRAADMEKTIETLISLKVDRILSSGQKDNVELGLENLAFLEKNYGKEIEICAGAGVNLENITQLIEEAGLKQVHGSFKAWKKDPSLAEAKVPYAYHQAGDYEIVDFEKVKEAAEVLKNLR